MNITVVCPAIRLTFSYICSCISTSRQLCKMYDIFLADDRILPSLPKLIGKSFFRVCIHKLSCIAQELKLIITFIVCISLQLPQISLLPPSSVQKKKQPVPIRVTSSLPDQVKKACSCTYMFKNSGTCINIKAGLSSFTQQQVSTINSERRSQ